MFVPITPPTQSFGRFLPLFSQRDILWVWGSVPRALRARGSPAKIPITRVSTKIRDGSISEINQCRKGNIFTKCDAFNPKAHNSTQILHISAPLLLDDIDANFHLDRKKVIFSHAYRGSSRSFHGVTTHVKPPGLKQLNWRIREHLSQAINNGSW